MIMQVDRGDDIQQINTDLLVNKLSAEDFKEIVDKVQNNEPLNSQQNELLIQANVLTPVKEIDLSMPDINIPVKAPVQEEEIRSPEIFPEQTIVEIIPTPIIKKVKIGILDKVTNYIYSIIFKK